MTSQTNVVGGVFISPQTDSAYAVVSMVGEVHVSYRVCEQYTIRVRVQGPSEALKYINDSLVKSWGEVKQGDHLSITVADSQAADAIADATRALCQWGINFHQ